MLLFMLILFGGIFGYYLYHGLQMKKQMSQMVQPPETVSAIEATYQFWQPKMQAAGTVRAVQGVDVTTEIQGLVRTIYFQPGTTVKAGDLLLALNADADTAQWHALQAAANLAKITDQRDQAQYQIHAISKAKLDEDDADLKSKQAQVAQQAAIVAQKNIHAPFGGKLGVSAVNVGQYLTPGNKIVTLQSLDLVYVDFYLPQQALVYLSKGQSVRLTTDTYPDETFTGDVTTIDPKIDSTTRNVQIEATVQNKEEDHLLLPGMFVQAEVNTGEPHSYITLPQTAITFNPYGEVAFVAHASDKKDAKGAPIFIVSQRFITTGEKRGDQVAVLKGIEVGDRVITSGGLKLKNESQVVIDNSVTPTDDEHPNIQEE